MSKKGGLFALLAGLTAGAAAVFLSKKENRAMAKKELTMLENEGKKVVKKVAKATKSVKPAVKKAVVKKVASKKTTKKKTTKRR